MQTHQRCARAQHLELVLDEVDFVLSDTHFLSPVHILISSTSTHIHGTWTYICFCNHRGMDGILPMRSSTEERGPLLFIMAR